MPLRFKSIVSRILDFGLIGILVLGLLIGAVRLASPFADLFRPELEGVLSETLGMEVRVGRLKLRLAGLTPRLRLRGTALLNPDSLPQLKLTQLWVDLSPLASLRALAPRIESVTLVGTRLVVKRLPTGEIVVTGLEGLTGDDPEALGFFLGHGRFQLVDSHLSWVDEQTGAPPLHLSGVRVHFENWGERHRIGVFAHRLGDRQSQLRLVGDLHGEPRNPTDWSGELYLRWQGHDLGRVLAGWLPADLGLGSESVTIESWNRLEDGRPGRSLSRIEATGLRVWTESGEANAPPLDLEHVAGLLRWRRIGTGWRLEVKDLALPRDGNRRLVSDFGVRFAAADDGGWALTGGSRILDLADVRDLLTRLPWLPPEVRDRLDATHPGGGLHDLRFRFVHRPGFPPYWAASARVEDLSLDAHGQLPGIRGLTAELAANERAGRLVLSDDDLSLDLPRLFPRSLGIDAVAGEVRWQREREGTLWIGSRGLTADNADIATRSRFSMVFPADGGSPFLDLQTEFRDLEIAMVPDYLPSRILRKKLTGWLEQALVGGDIPHGAMLFRGVAADFPFDDRQGRFQVLFAVRDCTLNFNRDWPSLKKLVGEARFENREMALSFSKGRFLDSDAIDVSARIPDLGRAVAVEVRGRTEGPFTDDIRVLGETPLRKRFGVLAKLFRPEGKARLDLDLAIPLNFRKHKNLLRIAGELSWPGLAALATADQSIRLTDLTGKLRFTERDLQVRSIEAKLWKVPVRLRVDTRRSGQGAGPTTHIRATGRFSTAVLARQFPSPAWQLLRGQAPLVLDLTLTGTSFGKSAPPLDIELTSDLTGLALELPAPLGKPAARTRQLRLATRLAAGEALRIQGAYGDLGIDLGLDQEGDGGYRLARGVFNLGGPAPSLPEHQGLHLGGSVAALDLRPWLDWWADRKGSRKGGPGGDIPLRSAQVHVGRLLLADTTFNDVRFEVADRSRRWEAEIHSQELAGKVTVPHHPRSEPVRVRLTRLDLKGLLGQEHKDGETPADKRRGQQGRARKDDAAPTAKRPVDPRRTHTLDLTVERLLWGKNSMGRLALRSRMAPDGLEFPTLSLTGPVMSIKGQGSWLWTDTGSRSNLSLTAQGRDLGKFLRNLEFKNLFHQAPAEVDLDLAWSGAPVHFSAVELQGQVRIELGAGSLLEVEPGVGRVLGLLNLQALQRRLALDFNDLFGRGYVFEKVSGRFDIAKGSATIAELLIEGPAADVSIVGTTNLVAGELNQVVTVTPHIGAGAAIAGAVAGGPLVGAAVFLVDQVFGGMIDKLGRHQYYLSGPWAEPEIQRGGLVIGTPESPQGGAPKDGPPSSPGDEDENPFLKGY